MADYEDSGEEDLGLPDENDDHSALRPCQQRLGISAKYVRDWTKANAFREFCQNWMDAMIQASGVSREELVYVRKNLANEFRITVHNPGKTKIFGFLAFHRKRGMLELCNYDSQLPREVLDMGGTSKDMNDTMAGTHGEGFKLAALLMVRHGHQAKFTASKFYWNFRWGVRETKTLWCFLSEVKRKPTQQKLNSQDLDASKFRVANPSEDVSVRIGNVYGKKAKSITEDEVMEWLKVCLHFDRPKEAIHTEFGTLILQRSFKGKIYLKGLLLEKLSNHSHFQYGYDFSQGHIGRDRKGMEDPEQLEFLLAKIWERAVTHDTAKSLDIYIAMLLDDQNRCRDVSNISSLMTQPVAEAIWNRLQVQDAQRKKFYHGPKNADEDAAIIRSSLKKTPVFLPDRIWTPLRKYELVRTPLEYRKNIMCNAEIASILDTPYCVSIMRTLSAALALDPQTKSFQLEFKKAGDMGLDLYLDADNSQLLLHEKWMEFEKSHAENSKDCILSHMRYSGDHSPIEIFSCDHIIIEICSQVFQELDRKLTEKRSLDDQHLKYLPLQVGECLKNMSRAIQACPGPQKGEICVSWEDNEAGKLFRLHKMKLNCCVTLHRESSCNHRRWDLIAREPGSDDNSKDSDDKMRVGEGCGCLQKIVACTTVDNQVIFSGLSLTESYFPMVSRAYTPIAFFGVPPVAQKPKQHDSKIVTIPLSSKSLSYMQRINSEDKLKNAKAGTHSGSSESSSRSVLPADKSMAGVVLMSDHTPKGSLSTFRPICFLKTNLQPQVSKHIQNLKFSIGLRPVEEDLKKRREELRVALGKLQKAQPEHNFTQNYPESGGSQHGDPIQQGRELNLQIASASSEVEELKAKNDSQNSLLKSETREEVDLTAKLITIQSEKEELERQLINAQSEKETLQQKFNDLQNQTNFDHESSEAQAPNNELQNRIRLIEIDIGRLQHINEQLQEEIREANEQKNDAITQKNRAIAQRNEALIQKYEADVQKNDSIEAAARLSRGAGIKRGRSPSLGLGAGEGSAIGNGGSNSFAVTEEQNDLYGANPLHQNGQMKFDQDSMADGGRSAKRGRRETPEVIELD
ncbi:hypothetical protein NHQ30_011423 [Ciborinia camelliae]|nr:hypothetical protein NHQ30_011423 [Ciborinia camelliae]